MGKTVGVPVHRELANSTDFKSTQDRRRKGAVGAVGEIYLREV
jgi:hypothetical protein